MFEISEARAMQWAQAEDMFQQPLKFLWGAVIRNTSDLAVRVLPRFVHVTLAPGSVALERAMRRLCSSEGADAQLVRMYVLQLLEERDTLRATLKPFAQLGDAIAHRGVSRKHTYKQDSIVSKRGSTVVRAKDFVVAKAVHLLTATVGDLHKREVS